MTQRQTMLYRRVCQHADKIRALVEPELKPYPPGNSVIAPLPTPFELFSWHITRDAILVTKTRDGFDWLEWNPLFFNRKGRTRPKPRPLP